MKTKPYGKNSYCGPAVLSMLFDISTDEAARRVREDTGRRCIKWMFIDEMDRQLNGKAEMVSLQGKRGNPTLRRVVDEHVKPSGTYVALLTGHFILIHKGQVYDNGFLPYKSTLKSLSRRRVVSFWKVFN